MGPSLDNTSSRTSLGLPGEVVALIAENLDFDSWLSLSEVDSSFLEWMMNPVRLQQIVGKAGFIVKPKEFDTTHPQVQTDFSWYAVPPSETIKKTVMDEQKRRMNNIRRVRSLMHLIARCQQGKEYRQKLREVTARPIVKEFISWISRSQRRLINVQHSQLEEGDGPAEQQRLEDLLMDKPSMKTHRWVHCADCGRYYPYLRPQLLHLTHPDKTPTDEYFLDGEGLKLLSLLKYSPDIPEGLFWRETKYDLCGSTLELEELECRHQRSVASKELQDKMAMKKMARGPRRFICNFLKAHMFPDPQDSRQPIEYGDTTEQGEDQIQAAMKNLRILRNYPIKKNGIYT